MDVAVVLSPGGNQLAEISGGAAITVTPEIPFKMAQRWDEIWNHSGSIVSVLNTVPIALKAVRKNKT